MLRGGRVNANPRSSHVLEHRRLLASYYNSVHRARVNDVNVDQGTCTVSILDAGDFPRRIPIPLLGFSFPPQKNTTDKNYLRTSWGVYIPQVNDIVLIAFDAIGLPHCLGYSYNNFPDMRNADDANEERGGIGWADASGKRLRSGDWSFKSSGGSFIYLSDRASFSCGPHAVRMEKSSAVNELTLQSCLIHSRYGDAAEVRAGGVRRFLVPGVDTTERDVYGTFGTVAQEYTNYVRRGSFTNPTGMQMMVHLSEGEVIDDLTGIVMVPAVSATCADLLPALVGTGVRSLKLVKDDLSGMVDQYAEIVDNLGNYGVSAKLATGFMWNTPVANWTIQNLITTWNTKLNYDLIVGTNYTVKSTLAASIEAVTSASLKAGTTVGVDAGTDLSLKAGGKGSLVVGTTLDVTASAAMTLTAPSIALGGSAASEPLVKGTSFIAALADFLTGLSGIGPQMKALSVALGALGTASTGPLAPLAVSFGTCATAAGAMSAAADTLAAKGATLLSTVSKTV